MNVSRRLLLIVAYISLIAASQFILWFVRRNYVTPLVGSQLKRIQGLIILEFLMSLGSILIWFRCSQLTSTPTRKKSISVVEAARLISKKDVFNSGLILFLVFTHMCYVMFFVLLSEEPHILAVLSFSCAGAFIYLAGFLFFFSAWEFFFLTTTSRLDWLRGVSDSLFRRHPKFRMAVVGSRFHTLLSLVLALLFTGFGLHAAHSPPVIHYQTVYLKSLPGAFDGFNISLVTDVHIGPTVGRQRVVEAVKTINSLHPGWLIFRGS